MDFQIVSVRESFAAVNSLSLLFRVLPFGDRQATFTFVLDVLKSKIPSAGFGVLKRTTFNFVRFFIFNFSTDRKAIAKL